MTPPADTRWSVKLCCSITCKNQFSPFLLSLHVRDVASLNLSAQASVMSSKWFLIKWEFSGSLGERNDAVKTRLDLLTQEKQDEADGDVAFAL